MDIKNNNDTKSNSSGVFSTIDIIDIWNKFYNSKEIIIYTTLIFSIIAIIYAIMLVPIYRAELLMVPSADTSANSMSGGSGSGLSGLASIAGIKLGGTEASLKEQNLAILTSRTFTDKYIEEKNLLPIIFKEAWDEKNNKWKGGEPSKGAAHKTVANFTFLNIDEMTGLISLGIEWTDPVFAAEWANEIIVTLNAFIRQQAIEETEKNILFLQQQLKQTNYVNIQYVLNNLIEKQTNNIMLANVREEYAFKVIDPAVIPEQRIRPKRRQIAMTGFIFGLFFGLFGVIAKDYFYELKAFQETKN